MKYITARGVQSRGWLQFIVQSLKTLFGSWKDAAPSFILYPTIDIDITSAAAQLLPPQ